MFAKLLALNPGVILAALAAGVCIVLGSYFYGVSNGKAEIEAKWQTRESKINAESAQKIATANARVLAAERKNAADVADISGAYQKKLQEKDHEKDRAIASARASGLFVSTKRSSCGNAVPQAGPGPSGRDDPPRSELSDEASEYFVSEAHRANKIVEQLTACQALVRADRQTYR